jgi:hypothetical protein
MGCCGSSEDVRTHEEPDDAIEFDYDTRTGAIDPSHTAEASARAQRQAAAHTTPPQPVGLEPGPHGSRTGDDDHTESNLYSAGSSVHGDRTPPPHGRTASTNSMRGDRTPPPHRRSASAGGSHKRSDSAPNIMFSPLDVSDDGPPPPPTPGDLVLLPQSTTVNPTAVNDDSFATNLANSVQSVRETTLLTPHQLRFIGEGRTVVERLTRLQEVEAARRGELIGAFLVTTKMLDLAKKRIRPVMRVRPGQGDVPVAIGTLVIHHEAVSVYSPKEGERQRNREQFNREFHRDPMALRDVSQRLPLEDADGALTPTPAGAAAGAPVAEQQSLITGASDKKDAVAASAAMSTRRADEGPRYTNLYSPLHDDERGAFSDQAEEPRQLANRSKSFNEAIDPGMPSSVQHMQMLEISGVGVPRGYVPKTNIYDTWDFLSMPMASQILARGDIMYAMKSRSYARLMEDERDVVQLERFVNLTGFADEMLENDAPTMNVREQDQMKSFTTVLVKNMYVMPGVNCDDITKELTATYEFQKACNPKNGTVHVWDDVEEPLTFRLTKTLIRFVFSVVVQFVTREITDRAELLKFRSVEGLVPNKVIFMERTRRKRTAKKEALVKVKSVIMYFKVTGGTLVSHSTNVVMRSVPRIVARFINNFTSGGAREAADVGQFTTAYVHELFGDFRDPHSVGTRRPLGPVPPTHER